MNGDTSAHVCARWRGRRCRKKSARGFHGIYRHIHFSCSPSATPVNDHALAFHSPHHKNGNEMSSFADNHWTHSGQRICCSSLEHYFFFGCFSIQFSSIYFSGLINGANPTLRCVSNGRSRTPAVNYTSNYFRQIECPQALNLLCFYPLYLVLSPPPPPLPLLHWIQFRSCDCKNTPSGSQISIFIANERESVKLRSTTGRYHGHIPAKWNCTSIYKLLRSTRQGYFNLFRPDVCGVCARPPMLHKILFSCAEHSNFRMFFCFSAASLLSEHHVNVHHLSALGECMWPRDRARW